METTFNLPLVRPKVLGIAIFMALSLAAFFVPFTLGHPQWLVGSAVNAALFLAAAYLPKKYFIPLAILPSLGVLSRGLVFGPLTMFLVYFLPFIWIGNLILILVFSNSFPSFGFLKSIVLAAAAKFLALILTATLYVKFSIAPAIFLNLMGTNQLATALAGGVLAWIIFLIYGKFITRGPRP